MAIDKKAEGGSLRFILLDAARRGPHQRRAFPPATLQATLAPVPQQ